MDWCARTALLTRNTLNEETPDRNEVDEFILEEIDSVPHLEALLLVWTRKPQRWKADEMAKELYVKPDQAQSILNDLAQRRLIGLASGTTDVYEYDSAPEKDALLKAVERTYRRELVRISRMIHSKAPASLREFARAFRFRKD